jgi:ABC-type glycerol-3-phosphate transport system substrate-binding protein
MEKRQGEPATSRAKFDSKLNLTILQRMRRIPTVVAVLLSILLLLAACDQKKSNGQDAAVTLTPATVTPEATAAAARTPDFTTPITDTEQSSQLTVWIAPELASRTEGGAAVFGDQLLAFSANHPNLDTNVELKPVEGQGGILSYLRTGQDVAPDVLPDLVALPTEHLAVAAAEELIFPLDELIDPLLVQDLYPVALTLTRLDGQSVGYPFALTNLSHAAFNENVITSSLSSSWSELIAEVPGEFIFPGAGDEGAVLALQFYLALGGTLTNEAGQPSLQVGPLVDTLELLRQGRSVSLIALQSSNLSTLDESWRLFQAGSAVLAQTTADQFLRERSADLPAGFAPMPGPTGSLTPLVTGWVWAVSTPDPAQRALAVELLSLLVAEPAFGDWSLQGGILPARASAFARWPSNDPYTTFLQRELERAQPNPLADNSVIITALSDAVFDVLSLSKSPQAAAEEAAATVQP